MVSSRSDIIILILTKSRFVEYRLYLFRLQTPPCIPSITRVNALRSMYVGCRGLDSLSPDPVTPLGSNCKGTRVFTKQAILSVPSQYCLQGV